MTKKVGEGDSTSHLPVSTQDVGKIGNHSVTQKPSTAPGIPSVPRLALYKGGPVESKATHQQSTGFFGWVARLFSCFFPAARQKGPSFETSEKSQPLETHLKKLSNHEAHIKLIKDSLDDTTVRQCLHALVPELSILSKAAPTSFEEAVMQLHTIQLAKKNLEDEKDYQGKNKTTVKSEVEKFNKLLQEKENTILLSYPLSSSILNQLNPSESIVGEVSNQAFEQEAFKRLDVLKNKPSIGGALDLLGQIHQRRQDLNALKESNLLLLKQLQLDLIEKELVGIFSTNKVDLSQALENGIKQLGVNLQQDFERIKAHDYFSGLANPTLFDLQKAAQTKLAQLEAEGDTDGKLLKERLKVIDTYRGLEKTLLELSNNKARLMDELNDNPHNLVTNNQLKQLDEIVDKTKKDLAQAEQTLKATFPALNALYAEAFNKALVNEETNLSSQEENLEVSKLSKERNKKELQEILSTLKKIQEAAQKSCFMEINKACSKLVGQAVMEIASESEFTDAKEFWSNNSGQFVVKKDDILKRLADSNILITDAIRTKVNSDLTVFNTSPF